MLLVVHWLLNYKLSLWLLLTWLLLLKRSCSCFFLVLISHLLVHHCIVISKCFNFTHRYNCWANRSNWLLWLGWLPSLDLALRQWCGPLLYAVSGCAIWVIMSSSDTPFCNRSFGTSSNVIFKICINIRLTSSFDTQLNLLFHFIFDKIWIFNQI